MCFASGHVLPSMMIFPHKQTPPGNFCEGAVAQTLFSNNGCINNDLFLQWFKFFLASIPPTQPVLLIMNGHGTHISVELIKLHSTIQCCLSFVSAITHYTSFNPWMSVSSSLLKAIFQRLAANILRLTQEE